VRVLVDTSVWSLLYRRSGPADHRAVRKLTALLEGDQELVLTCLILEEFLQAFQSEAVFRKMALHLEPFPLLPITRSVCVRAARLQRECAAAGIAAATVDCQIAATAIEHECLLLTADADFERIAELSPLRLA
jgi:predicted nucleic acid-binding protein